MKLRTRIDRLSSSTKLSISRADYFPHIERTVEGAIRLQLEFDAERELGGAEIRRIRKASDAELLRLLGYAGDAESMALFSWRHQNWISLICSNLGVMDANRGEYGGPSLEKPFVEGAPIYFPLYAIYYHDYFRQDRDKAAICNYDLSKSGERLVLDWWNSEPAKPFAAIKGQWLSQKAEWLWDHFDIDLEICRILGLNDIDSEELSKIIDAIKPLLYKNDEERAEASKRFAALLIEAGVSL